MRRQMFIALLLSAALLFAGSALPRVAAEAGRGGSVVPAAESQKGFFKALARLFGGGGKDKKDKKKEKSERKAETAAVAAAETDAASESDTAAPAAAPTAAQSAPKVERMTKDDARDFQAKAVAQVKVTDSASAPVESFEAGEASAHVARGRALLSEAKYFEASVELAAAVALDPKRGEAHNLLGVALDGRGSHQLAIDQYKQALRLMPDDAQILNNLGYSYYLNEDLSSAKKYLQKAARRAPRDERVLNNLATVQYRLGKRKDALESFVRASDPFTGRMNLAALLSRFGNYSEAAELYEEAHRLEPRSAEPLEKLAAAYERMGRKSDAEGVRQAAAALKLNGANTATNGN